MEIIGKIHDGSRNFEFWGQYNMLFTIGTSSMREIQWYRACYNTTETYRVTPKICLVQVIPVE
jgi:hypothetical protein